MTTSQAPSHVVVDGSNIATEGRSLPSLAQLSEAVMAFMEDYPETSITVVVDATFGHRIDKKEVKEFEEGIANNELVAPPAGAVGRGDAFVLSIAQKAHSSILSNDSFQEFHGDYEWLFDEGRLIGGKPVPHVGWVFVDRTPVRGPVSRKATGGKGGSGGGRRKSKSESPARSGRKASAESMEPMPVPKSPPPRRAAEPATPTEVDETPVRATSSRSSGDRDTTGRRNGDRESSSRNNGDREKSNASKAGDTVNDLMPFLEFVEHHPVGTSVNGTVESYSSHGAYVAIGDAGVRGYVPLRLMADPAPTSARKVMKLGESVTLVVVSFAPVRRSIDCAVPDLADAAIAAARAEADDDSDAVIEAAEVAAAEQTSLHEAAPASDGTDTPTRAAAKKSPARKVAAKKVPAKKAPAKQAAAKQTDADKAAAKKAPAKKAPATKAAAEKVPATKAAAKKVPATKAAAKKAPATKAAAKKVPATKAAAKKAPATKAAAKKVPATKAAAKKAATRNVPSTQASAERTTTATTKPRGPKAPARNSAAGKPVARQAPAETTGTTATRSPAKKSAAAKKAAPVKKSAPAKTSAPAKKSVTARKSAPAKRTASEKPAASTRTKTNGTDAPVPGRD